MSSSLLIVGSGGHAKMALECALSTESYDRITFMTSDLDRPAYLAGFAVVGEGTYEPPEASALFDEVFVAIGDNASRKRVQREYEAAGARMATLVHRTASVSRYARLGPGTILMPQSVVNAFARVGRGCIVNSGAIVEHDCLVGDWSHLSPNAAMGGWCELGEASWMCMGSVMSDHLRACSGITLAANSTLLVDAEEPGLYVGSPAELRRAGVAETPEDREVGHPNLAGKRLLVLAGAEPHVKVVEAARELGVHTIVTDYLEPNLSPAKLVADEHWELDILGVDSIVARCLEEGVDGVLSFCIDPAQRPYAEICERLALPCCATLAQMEAMTSKSLFKRLCGEVGVATVPSYDEDDVAAGTVEYPVLVKPSESRGSRGQSICRSREEALSAIGVARSASADGMAIVERYLEGAQDVSLSYVVVDGVPYMLKCGDRTLGASEDGLSTQHILTVSPSSRANEICDDMEATVRDIVAALGIEFGLIFLQGLMEGGRVMPYDPGMRLPGSDFDVAVRNVTGFDPMKTAVQFALTGDVGSCWGDPVGAWRLNGGVAVILSVAVRPGIVGSFEGLDRIAADPRVYSAVRRLEVGEVVPASGDVRQRAAEFVAYLPGRYALGDFLEFIYSTVSIRDVSGEDMIVSKAYVGDDGSIQVCPGGAYAG